MLFRTLTMLILLAQLSICFCNTTASAGISLTSTNSESTQPILSPSLSCYSPGQACGNVDSPITDVNSTMYLCANGVCICNFIYLNPIWQKSCDKSNIAAQDVIVNSLNPAKMGTVSQATINSECNGIRSYRQCIANILGQCALLQTTSISNQPDNCSVKWQTYVCTCRNAGPLCYSKDLSACFGNNDPTIFSAINAACNGVCNQLQPSSATSTKLTMTTMILLAALVFI
jgi:hypothetical protein